ncbi:MAG TPA: metallophosphoesterase, partial [Ilumatobacteraceae bacterium]|nr:metallophosphoesterase [Ilumatobacteraceae bacterium]
MTTLATPVHAAPVTLTVLTFNDFHGRINNNTVRFATTIEQLRAAAPGGETNTLLISAGDNIGASEFTSSSADDQPTIDVLNALDVAVSAVGNHEFDKGIDFLQNQVIDGVDYNKADFPYLGANVYAKATTNPVLDEYTVVNVAGVRVGIIGAVTVETPSLVSSLGIANVDFGDPVAAVNRVADQLTDGDPDNGEADVIIADYHEGADLIASLAAAKTRVPFAKIVDDTSAKVDIIVNGHTHQPYTFDAPVPSPGSGNRPVIQTGSYGGNIGKIQFDYDADTDTVTAYSQSVVPTASVAPDLNLPRVGAVNAIVAAAQAAAAIIGEVPVASVTADITTAWKSGGYTN